MARYVNSTIKINAPVIKKLEAAAIKALEQTAEKLHTDIINANIMPRDTGAMEESVFVDYSQSDKGQVSIITNTPYARRLYYHPEYKFNTAENANAQGKWLQSWVSGDKSGDALNYYKRFMNRLM